MPAIKCAFCTCQHNTSTTPAEKGLCNYPGELEMEMHEDEVADDQFLDCLGYVRAKGKKFINNCAGTVYFPVELE